MGVVRILSDTTDTPIEMIGRYAGICWGGDCNDHEKNYKRGLNCIKANHGRTLEFVQVYMELEGYSARVMREFYTHIGGMPTRLQESTRYIDYKNFNCIVPPAVEGNSKARWIYSDTLDTISKAIAKLEELGVPREDSALLLPLGMESKVVVRTNLRNLIDMGGQRKCSRANWEFRQLFKDFEDSLAFYSDEWDKLVNENKIFKCKCDVLGYCPEAKSCGRKENKNGESKERTGK